MITREDMERVFGAYEEPDDETLFLEMCDDFCVQVIFEMERQGLTVSELARRMGVAQSTLSQQLSGEQNLTAKTMDRIARALGCVLEAPRLVRPSEIWSDAVPSVNGVALRTPASTFYSRSPETASICGATVSRRVSGNVWTARSWKGDEAA